MHKEEIAAFFECFTGKQRGIQKPATKQPDFGHVSRVFLQFYLLKNQLASQFFEIFILYRFKIQLFACWNLIVIVILAKKTENLMAKNQKTYLYYKVIQNL